MDSVANTRTTTSTEHTCKATTAALASQPFVYGFERALVDPRSVIAITPQMHPILLLNRNSVTGKTWHGDCEMDSFMTSRAAADRLEGRAQVLIEKLEIPFSTLIIPHMRCRACGDGEVFRIDHSRFFSSLEVADQWVKDTVQPPKVLTTACMRPFGGDQIMIAEFAHGGSLFLMSAGLAFRNRGFEVGVDLYAQHDGRIIRAYGTSIPFSIQALKNSGQGVDLDTLIKNAVKNPLTVIALSESGTAYNDTLEDPVLLQRIWRTSGLIQNALVRGFDSEKVHNLYTALRREIEAVEQLS